MHRRLILASAAAAASLLLAGCSSAPDSTVITTEKLQRTLGERFPRSYPLAGLLELELAAPRVTPLPDRNRLQLQFDLQARGALLRSQRPGLLELELGLRWEPDDYSLRAQDVRVNALQLQGLPTAIAALLTGQGGALAERALQDAPLYRLQGKDLERARQLGVQPGTITVTPEGLRVQLVRMP